MHKAMHEKIPSFTLPTQRISLAFEDSKTALVLNMFSLKPHEFYNHHSLVKIVIRNYYCFCFLMDTLKQISLLNVI